jgi:hypothetical protein
MSSPEEGNGFEQPLDIQFVDFVKAHLPAAFDPTVDESMQSQWRLLLEPGETLIPIDGVTFGASLVSPDHNPWGYCWIALTFLDEEVYTLLHEVKDSVPQPGDEPKFQHGFGDQTYPVHHLFGQDFVSQTIKRLQDYEATGRLVVQGVENT